MSEPKLGLRSEELRAALTAALAGSPSRLGDLLARHGGLPGRPNLALAEAFGDSVAEGKDARALLDALRAEDEEDGARTFLPIAAAFGYAARLKSDPRHAWRGVHELTADDRAVVRLGTIAALRAFATRARGNVDQLVAHASEWLEGDDREHVYASQALALDVVSAPHGIDGLEDREALCEWLARVLDVLDSAKRADERSLARRRLLAAIPDALAEVASSLRGAPDGIAWLTEQFEGHPHPDLRAAFDRTIDALRRGARAQPAPAIEALTAALASTKKAPRDPTLIRDGRGRGKRARRRSR